MTSTTSRHTGCLLFDDTLTLVHCVTCYSPASWSLGKSVCWGPRVCMYFLVLPCFRSWWECLLCLPPVHGYIDFGFYNCALVCEQDCIHWLNALSIFIWLKCVFICMYSIKWTPYSWTMALWLVNMLVAVAAHGITIHGHTRAKQSFAWDFSFLKYKPKHYLLYKWVSGYLGKFPIETFAKQTLSSHFKEIV